MDTRDFRNGWCPNAWPHLTRMEVAMKISDHFKKFDGAQRAALEETWARLKKLLPDAEEGWSYNLPTLKVDGKSIVSIEGFKKHNSLFPHSGSVLSKVDGLEAYKQSKGTLQFPMDKPLSNALLKRIIKAKFDQILHS